MKEILETLNKKLDKITAESITIVTGIFMLGFFVTAITMAMILKSPNQTTIITKNQKGEVIATSASNTDIDGKIIMHLSDNEIEIDNSYSNLIFFYTDKLRISIRKDRNELYELEFRYASGSNILELLSEGAKKGIVGFLLERVELTKDVRKTKLIEQINDL